MATFTRTYTTEYATKVTPSMLAAAKEREGHRKVQEALEALGADQDEDGRYLIDSVPAKEQVGIVFDMFVWQIYRRHEAKVSRETAEEQSHTDTEDDFEHGGNA